MGETEQCTICKEESARAQISTPKKLAVLAAASATFIGTYALIGPFVLPAFRKICLPFVPATTNQVCNVFKALAGRSGRLLDIGSGDGRIVFEGARQGFSSHGVELNPWLVLYSRIRARHLGLAKSTHFYTADLWKTDISSYDCVVVFGVDTLMTHLERKVISELGPSSCVVACRFPFRACYKPSVTIGGGLDTVWLYTRSSFDNQQPVTAACFADGFYCRNCLIVGDTDATVTVWSLTTRRSVASFRTTGSCLWLGFIEARDWLIVQSRSGHVTAWTFDGVDWTMEKTTDCADVGFCRGKFISFQSGICLAIPTSGNNFEFCDPFSFVVKARISSDGQKDETKRGSAMCLADIPETDRVVIGYENGMIALWDMSRGELDARKFFPEPVMCVDFSGNFGVSGSVGENFVVWRLANDQVEEHRRITMTNPGANDVSIRRDNKLFAVACWDGSVRLYSGKSFKPLAVLDCHSKSVNCVTFKSDGAFAVTSNDCTISLWDVYA